MAKKYILKALSVGLSLVMCAGMVTPAFAASFSDLNNAISGNGGTKFTTESGDRYGYGVGEGSSWEIEAWDEGDTRNVQLNEDVNYDSKTDKKNTISVTDKVNLDLNGNNVQHSGVSGCGVVFSVTGGGELTLDDKTAATDADGNYTAGKVSGGATWQQGGGVYVAKGSSFVLKNGIISENRSNYGGGINNAGTVIIDGGQISENAAVIEWNRGGGIYNVGTIIMNGGLISGNTAEYIGGGVYNGGTFELNGGEISGNEADHDGGGIFNGGYLTMNDGKISGNTCGADGGGVFLCGMWNVDKSGKATFTMNGGEVSDNKSLGKDGASGGISSFTSGDTFVMNGGSIVRNSDGVRTGDQPDNTMTIVIDYSKVTHICNYGKDGVADTMHNRMAPVVENRTATSYDLVVYCKECGGELSRTTVTITPSTTPSGNGGRVPDSTTSTPVTEPEADATIGIEDEAVPLAGIFTRADAIGYLWEQAGRPEAELSDFPDVPEEHYWAVAIGWAQDMGIALPDEDGNFRPDDMVLRSVEDLEVDPEGELQEFLNRYAVFAGVELDDGELFIELDGAAGDVIMGEEAQEIFNLFFALLEEALADQAA